MKNFGIALIVSFAAYSSAFAATPAQSPELLAKGKAAFATNCAMCHGDKGAGDGVAAGALNPKPRDFTKGQFKLGSKPEEIFNTITKGIAGTPMPPFPQVSEEDRWGLAYFVKSLKSGS